MLLYKLSLPDYWCQCHYLAHALKARTRFKVQTHIYSVDGIKEDGELELLKKEGDDKV